jgi:hypothetical protein
MNVSPIILTVVGCILTMVAVGCAANKPFRTDYTTGNPAQTGAEDPHAVIESTPDYKLGFVEFDDQGWVWEHSR